MKSILLINPPNSDQIRSTGYYLMPLSLLYLSGTTRLVANTSVLDLNVAKRKYYLSGNAGEFPFCEIVKNEVGRLRPDVVGVTCLFSGQIEMVLNIVDTVKKELPSSTTVLGGMHPTIFHAEILHNCPNVDAVVIGEGEKALEKILTTDKDSWKSIDGLAFRERNNAVTVNEKKSFVDDIDTLPRPAYDLFDFDDYKLDSSGWYNPKKIRIGTSVPILTSRSCPFKCSFCGMNLVMGTRFRPRSADDVFQEIEYLYRAHNVRYFNIMDDNFSLDKNRIKQICRNIIDSKMELSFDIPNGIMTKTLDDEVIDLLAQAGFIYCFLAIESGSDFIRNKVMNKGLSNKVIFRVVKSFRRHPSIHLLGFFIMGMPEETRETLKETVALIEALDLDDFKMSVATPFPGTKLFEQCQRDNLFVATTGEKSLLWRKSDWHQRILNDESQFFIKPYAMELRELDEYARKFEFLRHNKHLATVQQGRQTLSITEALSDFRRRHSEVIQVG